MKLSRRELTIAAAALASRAAAQTSPPSTTADEQAKLARDANQRASEALAKFEIPMSTEPAFLFRP